MILCRKDCLPLTIKVSGRQILARKAQFRASSCRPLVLYLRRNINEDKSTHPNDRTVVWSSTSPLWRSGLRKRTRELKDQSLSTLRKMLVSLVRRRECFTFTGLSILLAYDILTPIVCPARSVWSSSPGRIPRYSRPPGPSTWWPGSHWPAAQTMLRQRSRVRIRYILKWILLTHEAHHNRKKILLDAWDAIQNNVMHFVGVYFYLLT